MCDPATFIFPDITADDIAWACRVMGFGEGAFDDARRNVIFSQNSLDVAACPGSGKTTLLVAKLAILARRWRDRRRGICVLSHTNAAREVIEDRLGTTAEGQLLLTYPHYVGTIHGFVNRFLGIPWLKACGFPIAVVDTENALSRRWKSLVPRTKKVLENKRNGKETLKVVTTEFSLGNIRWGRGILGRNTKTYKDMVASCRQTAAAGYFCYEDPFLWGRELVEVVPETVNSLRERFPILFVDEAQDNSEVQSNILHRVFVDGDTDVVCQRFGDANQAIYHSLNSKDAPQTWVFPCNDIKNNIPDSHRYGKTIAGFAQSLGVEPQALIGRGPDQRKVVGDVDDQHTIFLFDDNACSHVLPAYVCHLRNIFDQNALANGSFVAVGAKHKQPDNDNNKPNSVCDYWDKYAPEHTKAKPRPRTFIGFVQAGRARLAKDEGHNLHYVVEQVATGLFEAVRQAGGSTSSHQRKDRYIRETLEENLTAFQDYGEFIRRFVVDEEDLTKQLWNCEWKSKLSGIAEAMFEKEGEYVSPKEFFAWPDGEVADTGGGKAVTVYQHEDGLPKIWLGSIHSVKGETHTSVLVLETYNKTYSLKKIKKWILGKAGTVKQRNSQSARLRVHYVAVTRPTHLLCLAVPNGTFINSEISTLSKNGWRIARIDADGAVTWTK